MDTASRTNENGSSAVGNRVLERTAAGSAGAGLHYGTGGAGGALADGGLLVGDPIVAQLGDLWP